MLALRDWLLHNASTRDERVPRDGRIGVITQYGVLAYDIDGHGEPRFLLITSRSTRRWVIPRGNPIAGLSPPRSAAEEAYEEAGITGLVGAEPLGSYVYEKKRKRGEGVEARVHVFPLRATAQSVRFPEQDERETRWLTRREAADSVDERGLRDIILAFTPPPGAASQGPVATISAAPPLVARFRILRWLRALLKGRSNG